jgi:histidyl-tRNA synthetase
MQKPSLPKGTRDFSPEIMYRRQFIFNTIRQIFERYGFQPMETPALENLSVLTGKYGEEGDQLLFKILNSGDFLSEVQSPDFESGYKKLTPKISEKGLKYDLTVPFARFVVMNRHLLAFPFKRYQIQPVWRADRPQKGRYREFYQCDADVVGTDSLLCEAEIVRMIEEVLAGLGIESFVIKMNNRKILSGLAQIAGAEGKETDLAVAIDKLDKIGIEKVREELVERGFTSENLELLLPVLNLQGNFEEKTSQLEHLFSTSETGKQGLAEVRTVMTYLANMGFEHPNLELDISLARGLSYYTGAIFEVKATGVQIGSLSGGGRYDNLTGAFGLPGVSGVGISFGVDRLYDVMEELGLFPENTAVSTQILITALDDKTFAYGLKVLSLFRENGKRAELYPEPVKLKKQLDYANARNIPFVAVLGSEEQANGEISLKNMLTGEQKRMSIAEAMMSYEL